MEGWLSYFLNKAKLLIVVPLIVFLGTNTSHSTNSYAKTNKIAFRYLADDNRDLSNNTDKNSLVTNAITLLAYTNVFIDDNIKESKSIEHQLKGVNSSIFHLFSHGKPGKLLINNQWLHVQEIAVWLKANGKLQDKKQLNIYGCEFAKGQKGQAAVAYLEKELKITIAASTNITGKDGDWMLETTNQDYSHTFLNYHYNLQLMGSNDDFDGDGIINSIDIDDDNDGIVDQIENCNNSNDYISNQIITPATTNFVSYNYTTSNGTLLNVTGSNVFKANNNHWLRLSGLSAGSSVTSYWNFNKPVTRLLIDMNTNNGSQTCNSTSCEQIEIMINGKPHIIDNSNIFAVASGTPYGDGNVLKVTGKGIYKYLIENPGGIYSVALTGKTLTGGSGGPTFVLRITGNVLTCSTGLDNDNDNIPNKFDSDSDNDGCSDALEAGATKDQTPNYAFNSIDSNNDGLVDAVDNGDNGGVSNDGIIDYDSTYYFFSLNESFKACEDMDEDGYSDYFIDLDDDNDGILDKVECESLNTNLTANSDFENGVQDWTIDGAYILANAGGNKHLYYYPDIPPGGLPNDVVVRNNNIIPIINGGLYQIEFDAAWSSTNPCSLNYQFVLYSISNNTIVDFVGQEFSTGGDGATGTGSSPFIRNNNLIEFNSLKEKFITTFTTNLPTGDYYFGFKIQRGACSSGGARDLHIDNINIKGLINCQEDFDSDGIVNSYDLDSDGDGCPDAIEGGGAFTTSDVSNSGLPGGNSGPDYIGSSSNSVDVNLTGGTPTQVGLTGIPTVADQSLGQGLGDSQNENVIACTVDLSLIKKVNNAIPNVDDLITYSLVIKNDGFINATGVKVTDVLPPGLTYNSHTLTSSSESFTSNVWDIGVLPSNQSKTLQLTVKVNGAGTITNTAEISQSNPSDSDSTPNSNN